MPLLTVNDENTAPDTIVSLATCYTTEPDQINPDNSILKLRHAVSYAGRMEQGKWTREKCRSLHSASELNNWLNFVRRPGVVTYLFSHSLGSDLTLVGFWTLMESGEFLLSRPQPMTCVKRSKQRSEGKAPQIEKGLLVDADPPTILICWHKSGWRLICLDIRNYLDKPLSELAESVGFPALPCPAGSDDDAAALAECDARAAVVIRVAARLSAWHKKQEFGKFGLTSPAIAMAAFRHRFMRHHVYSPDDQDERDYEREAYYNGRTEAFWIGSVEDGKYTPARGQPGQATLFGDHPGGPFHLLDASSFYGAVAQFIHLPCRSVELGTGGEANVFMAGDGDTCYLSTVRLHSRSEVFPVRVNERTVFATGRFWTTLCGPELAFAARQGAILEVGRWIKYETVPLFDAYSKGLFAERLRARAAGERIEETICKTLLAVLHGKFMQRRSRWQVCPAVQAPQMWGRWSRHSMATGETVNYRAIAGQTEIEVDAGDAKHCFPAIAAWVTATGREWLRTWIKLAGRQNVLHCHTDGLLVTERGKLALEQAGLLSDAGIGSLRIVESSGSVAVTGPSSLRLGTRRIVSGVPTNAVPAVDGSRRGRETAKLREQLSSTETPVIRSRERDWRDPQWQCRQVVNAGGYLCPVVLGEPAALVRDFPDAKPCAESLENQERLLSAWGVKGPMDWYGW